MAEDGKRTMSTRHLPQRPLWTCRACGQPWPCWTYRDDALAELGAVRLALRMEGHRLQAAQELPDADEGLWHRFLGWTRSRQ